MKTLNLRICVALLAACILFPVFGSRALADTQKVTLTMSENEFYELSVPDTYKTVKTGDDGKITIRALLTLHLLRVPDCYVRADGPTPIDAAGRLGRVFLPVRQATRNQFVFDNTGRVTNSTASNVTLFNKIRDFIPRSEQSGPNGTSLLARAVKPTDGVSAGIINAEYAFAFGDSLDNSRQARELALLGQEAVHTEKFEKSFKDLNAGGVRLLTDPDAVESSSAGKDTLSQTSFRNNGRWYFDEYKVTSPDLPDQSPMPMMGVRVVWALEATFNPNNPPQIPLGSFASTAPEVAKALQGGAKGQDAASSSQPAAALGGLAAILGISGAQFSGLGTPAQTPGLDIVGGFAIRDNGTPPLLGVNITPSGKKPSAGLTDKVLDFNRLGILVGRTTDAQPAYVTALSLKVNSNALLYLGPSFSSSAGLTRSGLSFGAAFSLLSLLGGTPPAAASQAGKEIEVDLVQTKLTPFPCKKDTQAAILWTTPGTIAKAVDTITIRFSQEDAKSFEQRIEFPRRIGETGMTQFFWLQFVAPGTLTDVSAKKGTNDYVWSGGSLYLLQMTPPKFLDYATSKNLSIEKSQTYNIQVTTDASQLRPPRILKARPSSGQPRLTRDQGVHPFRVTASSLRSLVIRPVTAPPHRQILMHRMMASNFAPVALTDPPPALPLMAAAGRGGATDLTGAISPPAGVSLDQITLELRDAPNGRVLMSAQLPFIHDRKPDHFRWPISRPGVYYLYITANGRRLSAPRKVSPGTALGWVDIN